ncbi:hypothetical protein CYMTET_41051 [Cymbomonas tetramitiformis]|uniref:Uncharacterized protein n=1 Tax=Cymbomonas tetramitiformis TaxID=36881 RepID=A0AAE0C845_9CHLO|nr:hypothetical protein CYMTET_41051 [Cymbomonas tetramitiformis]
MVGGAQTGGSETTVDSESSDVSLCEKGVGDGPMILGVRSVHSQSTVEHFENDNFPESAFAEGEERDDEYTAEEWAAGEAGAYDSHEYGGASKEFAEHFDEYVDDEYYSDDY